MIHVKLALRSLSYVDHSRADHSRSKALRRLMAAVLNTAVDDYRGSADPCAPARRAHKTPAAVRRAIAYVSSNDRTWPYSFENLCEAVGVDAGRLRQELEKVPGG